MIKAQHKHGNASSNKETSTSHQYIHDPGKMREREVRNARHITAQHGTAGTYVRTYLIDLCNIRSTDEFLELAHLVDTGQGVDQLSV